jgi:hypothetical protein
LNLYITPVLGPGERKVLLRQAAAPLEAAESSLCEDRAQEVERRRIQRAIGEQRAKQLQAEAAKEKIPAKREQLAVEAAQLLEEMPDDLFVPRLLLDDATPEATVRVLAEQGGVVAVVSEEAGSLFEMLAGRYSQNAAPNLDAHLKAYDGGTIRVDRIGRPPLVVRNSALTILTTPQPAILDRIAAVPEFRGRGLIARICFVLPESRVGGRIYRNRPIDPRVANDYEDTIVRLAQLPIAPPEEVPLLHLTGAALDVWADFANELELGQADCGSLMGIRDWASKHAGRAARLAGIFHMIRHRGGTPWNHSISAEDVLAGWATAEWLKEHALVAFERMAASPESQLARRILAWIRRGQRAVFSVRDLFTDLRLKEGPDALSPGLQELAHRGFVRRQPDPPGKPQGGRRASPVFVVNPLTHPPAEPAEPAKPAKPERPDQLASAGNEATP